MRFTITEQALAPTEENHLFRPGALSALAWLERFDHRMSIDKQQLTSHQQALLEQEQIEISVFDDPADSVISLRNGILYASELEYEAEEWHELARMINYPERKASQTRTTNETDISVELNLDGSGKSEIDTGIRFFDHMLEQIARHGNIDLKLSCDGDLDIDEHHTIEDVGITLGETLENALGSKIGIERYGFVLPMDESQARVAIDFSGRPYLVFDGSFTREYVGEMPTEMVEHFFYSMAINMKATLQITVEGSNDHHKVEAIFKGFARAMRAAVRRDERNRNILPSSKGKL